MLESCYNLEPGVFELDESSFFQSEDFVNVLGVQYTNKYVEKIKEDVRSRLWFTYRRDFLPIGGTGPTSDKGWGCMLRCGQMLLAHTLIVRHLGREWRWKDNCTNVSYRKILDSFSDKKDKLYSLHQIAQMGVSERKEVGEWFGPATVCHVLKKLSVYDGFSGVSLHVAMDNAVIVDDVVRQANTMPKPSAPLTTVDVEWPTLSHETISSAWRPLLLLVPLRLGLATLNEAYIPAIKELFTMPECVGVIGGRPNHALYFVGCVGDELIYLDPHFCQPVDTTDDDSSFHCSYILHMPIANIDPSLAIGFLCPDHQSFTQLQQQLKSKGLSQGRNALFEVMDKRPAYWPPFVPYTGEDTPKIPAAEFAVMEPHCDTDEDFEILES